MNLKIVAGMASSPAVLDRSVGMAEVRTRPGYLWISVREGWEAEMWVSASVVTVFFVRETKMLACYVCRNRWKG